MDDNDAGMTAEQVLTVLDTLTNAGCWVSVEGGWGVDALVGHVTRPHRDLDLGLDAGHEAAALVALGRLGYRVETDWRPTRVELAAVGRGWVDIHPLTFDPEGNAYQTGLDGESYMYPAASFVTGHILGRPVRCLSAAQQVEWHAGYELRDSDRLDLVLLRRLVARERRPAIPAPPVDRHVLATRDEVVLARRELRILAEQHGLARPRVTASGAVLVGLPDQSDCGPLERFAAEAAVLVRAWVNVVAEDAPWAPTETNAAPL
jgi:lincosamide nucleotidyltransferase A/C/D/E